MMGNIWQWLWLRAIAMCLWIVDRCNYEFMNTVNIFWYYLTYIIIIITSVEWAISEYFSAFFQFNRIDIESTLQFFVFIMRT